MFIITNLTQRSVLYIGGKKTFLFDGKITYDACKIVRKHVDLPVIFFNLFKRMRQT